ncbi:MAG: peptidase M16-like [Candidatus Angelobacter sp.]|jgi:predicted Zn-dependent peptidase|nr:peptidase M16-like [Candidatus Angelobacter sp.]
MKRKLRPISFRLALLFTITLALCSAAAAQDIASFEKRITVKKLDNGLTLLVVERPEAPVFSFFTHVDVGSAQDPQGQSGLAHMFEHMAFKGTDKIGTTNFAEERKVLDQIEVAYRAYDLERRKETGKDPKKVAELEKTFKDLVVKAQQYVKVNEFGEIVERNGGVGLNAFTSMDETAYSYSMPSNDLELWAYLESQRFLHPVFREFYKERDVVVEERRMRTDSRPIGRLIEQLQAAAYMAHPYKHSAIGFYSEITEVNASDAAALYKAYYTPSNMIVTVVGDVKATTAIPLLEKYFSQLPKAPKPPDINTVEPTQLGEKTVTLRETGQPWYIEGYHRPDFRDPDDAVYDAISDLVANGRTSRLYRGLVRDKKIALFAGGQGGFPGNKYPNLYLFYAVPNQGKKPEELATAIHQEIEKLKTSDVTDEELQMLKTRAKADLIRGLGDNEGLAQQLGTYQALFGDWRELFRQVDRIDKVSKADIRRVAAKTFVPSNRTVAVIESVKPTAPAQKGGE